MCISNSALRVSNRAVSNRAECVSNCALCVSNLAVSNRATFVSNRAGCVSNCADCVSNRAVSNNACPIVPCPIGLCRIGCHSSIEPDFCSLCARASTNDARALYTVELKKYFVNIKK